MPVRKIEIQERIMAKNDLLAEEIRRRLSAAGVPAFNLISSPGSGKTSLLERTVEKLQGELQIALIAGDVQTCNDAERLARHTARLVHAVVTGGSCHLDARQVSEALAEIELDQTDLIFIENVGNLVCPASWDLGESAKIVLFSVTEGEDKPLKYPKAFTRARYVVFTKMDLLPHLQFDLERAVSLAREVNPQLRFFFTSAKTGQGLENWLAFLRSNTRKAAVP
ncbi:MAG: hydrogenase accessory protein HypB [Gemmatimonadales bacterium]|nr:MAG: hydrogenase accessory protein HypB [Gemmatimonadales bacterium]